MTMSRSYCSNRPSVRVSMTSRNPCVVTYRITDQSGNAVTAEVIVTPHESIFEDDFESGNASGWTEICSGASC